MPSAVKSRTLYFGGLPAEAAADDLRDVLRRFGDIEDIRVLPRRELAIAYVTFASEAAAHDARKALDGATWSGRRLRVEFAT